jgi:hypothetical protein
LNVSMYSRRNTPITSTKTSDILQKIFWPLGIEGHRLLASSHTARVRISDVFNRPVNFTRCVSLQWHPINLWKATGKRAYVLWPPTILHIQPVALFLVSKCHVAVTHWNGCLCTIPVWKARKILEYKFRDVPNGKKKNHTNKFRETGSLLGPQKKRIKTPNNHWRETGRIQC